MNQDMNAKFFNDLQSKPTFAGFERKMTQQLNSMLDKLASYESSLM